ncbi:MAG: hypothetical protein VX741_14470 [Pseudomonadota bacterium]|nr:hypothetical protein [Pseudomonadota bacterium]
MTTAIIESGVTSVDERTIDPRTMAIPATLQDALEARLDRLGEAREIAQIGAVIGRTFGYSLLAHVTDIDEIELHGILEDLTASELVSRRGQPPDATYTFKHALIQDTAYNSLLRDRRGEFHARVAGVLESEFPIS